MSENPKPLRVLIVGGGIAGPALAFWLQRLNHKCTIIERFPRLRTGGKQVNLRRHGIEAARRMGIIDEIRDCIVDEAGLEIVDESNKPLLFFPRFDADSKSQSFTSEFEIMRGDLVQILYEKTKDKSQYRFGLCLDSFEDTGDAVKVTLSDGSVEEYDILVGADGQVSRTRRALNEGKDEDYIKHLGVYTAYYTMERKPTDKDNAIGLFGTQQRFVLTRWHTPTLGQGYLVTRTHLDEIREALKQDTELQKETFIKLFKDIEWDQIHRHLAAIGKADDFYAHEVVQIRNESWSKGRVVLIGDAAHCSSFLSGMGSSSALVGAYVLAGEISKNQGNLGAAFEGYEQTLRPYIDRIQALGWTLDWLYPQTRLGLRVMQTAFKLMYKMGFHNSMQNGMFVDDRELWSLPDYEHLHAEERSVGNRL